MRRTLNSAATAVFAIALFVVSALPAWAATDPMTLTFVRHGQSTANAAGVIDTAIPGPGLTALGTQQAQDVAAALASGGYDGIYTSTMVRTQLTAAPLAATLHQPVVVLPGLQEIGAGIFEGTSDRSPLALGYALPPVAWALGLRSIPILGSTDGNAFDDRVDRAVKTIYDTGARKPVVFSHGATISFWVMMNVDNPDPFLILTHPLANTAVVVVNGSPDVGWTLSSWDGVQVDPHPSLITALFVTARNLIALPQTIAYQIGQAFAPRVADAIEVNQPAPAAPKGVTVAASAPEPATSRPALRAVVAADESTKKSAEKIVEKRATETPNGATDLTAGNKVSPGDPPATGDQRAGDGVATASTEKTTTEKTTTEKTTTAPVADEPAAPAAADTAPAGDDQQAAA